MTEKYILSLRVLNTEQLESGKESSTSFNEMGGAIGSHPDNQWSIQDLQKHVNPVHANVILDEEGFCLSALSPYVFVNNADIYKKKLVVKLQSDDIIQLCDLKIRVFLSNTKNSVDPLTVRPETLVSTYSDHLKEIMDRPHQPSIMNKFHETESQAEKQHLDPLAMLDKETLSPLNAVSDESFDNSLSLSHFYAEEQMIDDQFLDLPEITTDFNDKNNNKPSNVSLSPLLKGIGADIRLNNSQEIYDFMAEMGASLKKAIEGLLELHQTQNLFERKQLLPIEDNPLKLNLSYAQTINTLYGEESCPVHLAPSAAIEESLTNIRLHNSASQTATLQALQSLLQAFSPESLSKRFVRYRRASELKKPDDAWLWQMYRNYYQELVSNRQHGLKKLFQEVYEQTYDYELRRLQHTELTSVEE